MRTDTATGPGSVVRIATAAWTGTVVRRRAATAALLALAAGLVVLASPPPAADAMIWCNTDPVGDVHPGPEPSADIADYCVDYAETISLRVRTATRSAPMTDPEWMSDDTELVWEIRPHADTTSTYYTVTVRRQGMTLVARVNEWTFVGDWVSVGGDDYPADWVSGWIVVEDLPASAIRPPIATSQPGGFDYAVTLRYGSTPTHVDRAPDTGFLRVYQGLRPGPRGIAQACPSGEVPASGFDDVDPGGTHARAIDCVVWWHVASGIDDSRFAPDQPVTRGQMARFVRNAMLAAGYDFDPDPPQAFDDVEGTAHERWINQLAAAGIVDGTAPGRFGPNDTVSRAQMATFLVRAYEAATGATLHASGSYFDDVSGGHAGNVDRAAEAGFAAGVGERRFAPSAAVRRDQMATFVARMLDALVDNGHASSPR